MKVYWEVDDGYVGNRPHFTIIPDDEILDCETEEEAMQLISDSVQEDYEQKITWYFKSDKDIALDVVRIREKK